MVVENKIKMIKLKDLIKEEEVKVEIHVVPLKNKLKKKLITEKKVELYFRDDLKNKPISRQWIFRSE